MKKIDASKEFELTSFEDLMKRDFEKESEEKYPDVYALYRNIIQTYNLHNWCNMTTIYFIDFWEVKYIGLDKTKYVKIGKADDVKNRLWQLETSGVPGELHLDVAFICPAFVEKQLHDFFDEERRHKEWFFRTDRLNEFTDLVYCSKELKKVWT